jgi:CRP/FNR family transcriptional regulator, cyclic AMP receptor protein
MSTVASSMIEQKAAEQREDALVYLPRKGVIEYRRGQIIYDEQRPSIGLYLIVKGRVKVSITMEDGSQTVTGVYCADEFFGEAAMLGQPQRQERATTLENTTLMSWTTDEIEDQIERQPKLGMALIQNLVDRCLDFEARLQSMALDKTPQRVALCLLSFARRLGTPGVDGSVRIPPFTHQLLSEYVGTSREIVTFQMNHLRQLGLLRYSRKAIEIFVDALASHIRALEQ